MEKSKTEYIITIMKDGEMVDIVSGESATEVQLKCVELGYLKSAGYDIPNFPNLKVREG